VYPLLAGILNGLGGLEAVRWFSALCMLVPTTCAYAMAKRIYSQASGFAAAGLFAFLGPTLLLSRLATFDALCLALIALATLLAIQVSEATEPAGAVVLASLLILAFGAKYAAVIFVPLIIGLMAVRTLETRGWGRAALYVALSLATLAGLTFTLYHTLNHDFLHAIQGSTTNRAPITTASRLALVGVIVQLGGLLWLLGLAGFFFSDKRVRLISLGLVVSSLAMPAYHLYSGESVSLQKHVGYGLFFIAPLAGHAVAELVGRARPVQVDMRWLAALMIFVMGFVSGLSEANWWYQSWPNSSRLVATMRTQVRPDTGRYLCEDSEVVRYELADVTTSPEYIGLGFFQYPDANGALLTGTPAYVAAIQNSYFDLVELSEVSPLDPDLQAAIKANSRYQLIATIPYTNSYGSSYYLIWRKSSA
jgi:4-amino-4-deoxy-L-arabinose transferase-like glycosyltransferase